MLVPNQQLVELGRISRGLPHRFSYTLRNDSAESTHISQITVGCGSCTVASTDKSVLEPNGETTINVVFTPNSGGIQMKTVYIHYEGKQLKLTFSAQVY